MTDTFGVVEDVELTCEGCKRQNSVLINDLRICLGCPRLPKGDKFEKW